MRVLVVDHTAVFGGAQRSLVTQVAEANSADHLDVILASPLGELQSRAAEAGIETATIPPFEFGFASGPSSFPAVFAAIVRINVRLVSLCREHDIQLIHSNSSRLSAILGPTRIVARTPISTHLRDCFPTGRKSQLIRRAIRSVSTLVVANSAYTAASFGSGDRRTQITVAYNPLSDRFFETTDPAEVDEAREQLSRGSTGAALIGVVGQLSAWKQQDVAIRALSGLAGSDSVRLALVGSAKFATAGSRFENDLYLQYLHELVEDLGLKERVCFAGEIEDVAPAIAAMDILLMPSTEEPFGRVAVEAMALGTPVVATQVGGPPEYIEEGVSGLLRSPSDPQEWVEAIEALLETAEMAQTISANAESVARHRFRRDSPETQLAPLFRKAAGMDASFEGSD